MEDKEVSRSIKNANIKKKTKKKKQKSIYRVRWGRVILKTGLAMGLTVGMGGSLYAYNVLKDVPAVHEDALISDSSSNMYASNGELIWTSAKNQRIYVEFEDIPKSYIDLLLATEDAEFYENKGFSPKGLANAGISLVKEKLGKGQARGGSGIEQQLIKLSVFSTNDSDRTVTRKIKELFLSSQLYNNYSKEKILEFYINKIFMGENSYGAQTISNVYFNKNLDELTLSQQAIIAGLGQLPSAYNLYDDPALVTKRRDIVLLRGLDAGVITQAEYDEAKSADIEQDLIERNSRGQEVDKVTSFNNSFVTSALKQVSELGYDMEITPLQINTTLDMEANRQVRDILDNRTDLFQSDGHQAAVTVVDPASGHVIAEVGGRYANEIDGFNRATQTNRSTGSSIKPILSYGPAIEYFNWGTNHMLDGSPYTYVGTNITAYDYGGVIRGNSPMQEALRHSYNPPAIRTLNEVGEARAGSFIGKLGIESDQNLMEGVALGLDASATQMASAMGAFGQGGIYSPTQYVTSIEFSDKSIKEIKFDKVKAMRESTAYLITHMLKGVVSDAGTLPNGKIDGVTYAAKTGTVGYEPTYYIPSSAASDLWTVGYTKSLSVAVWQGYDRPMDENSYLSFYTQNDLNGLIFKEVMTRLSKGRDNSDWEVPNTVSKISGKGLSAHYQPNDSPETKVESYLDKPIVNSSGKYEIARDKDDNVYKVIKPEVPKVPEGYKLESWKEELKKEQDTFYEEHKNDKEEARNVGEDEKPKETEEQNKTTEE